MPSAARAAVDPGTVLVRFDAGVSRTKAAGVARRHHVRLGKRLKGTRFTVVGTRGKRPRDIERLLERDRDVTAVERNFIRRPFALPNDPLIAKGRQGWLETVRMPEAWDLAKGTGTVKLAIVDTAIDSTQPDLAADLLPGYDAVRSDVVDQPWAPPDSHATQVAAVAAARADNDYGIAGAAWRASILPVRVIDEQDQATDLDIVEGIVWAADQGAKVINLSLGGPEASEAMRQAVAYAQSKDVLVVAAAGNEGTDEEQFPAAYPGVVAVGATTWAGDLTSFSSWGDWVDLAAPGWDVAGSPSLLAPHPWAEHNGGTSFSAPVVSGVAVLLRTQHPEWTQARVAQQLTSTAVDAGPIGRDPFYGAGTLDAAAALGAGAVTKPPPPVDGNDTPESATTAGVGDTLGSIDGPTDEDWYRVSLPAAGRYAFSVEWRSSDPEGAILDLDLFSATLQPLGSGPLDTDGPRSVYLHVVNELASRSSETYTLRVASIARDGAPVRFLAVPLPDDVRPAAAGDVDGDGRRDLIGPDPFDEHGGVGWWRQDGDGTFEESRHVAVPQALDVAGGDFDADGKADAAVATGSDVRTARGTAAGFGEPVIVPGTARARLVDAADLDGDGRTDLVVRSDAEGGGGPWELAVLRNRTTGWTKTVLSTAYVFPTDLAIGDLTGDGRLDIAGGRIENGSQSLVVFRQRTDGTWSTETRAGLPDAVAIGDVTGDGFGDLVVAPDLEQRVLVYPQDAGHGLAPPTAYPAPITGALAIADVDRDGRKDVVSGGPEMSSLLLGRSDGTLAAPEQLPRTGLSILATDMTDDGLLDLIIGGVVLAPQSATWPRPAWILDTSPRPGVDGVATTATPSVHFGRALDPASVTPVTVRVEPAGSDDAVPASVAYDAGAQRATVKPSSALVAGSYDLVVEGVVDLRGVRIEGRRTVRFTVGSRSADTTPPDTRLLSAVWKRPYGDATFDFWAPERGVRFECSFDAGAYKPCVPPVVVRSSDILPGEHRMSIRAKDAAGNVDATPALGVIHVPQPGTGQPKVTLTGTSGSRAVDTRTEYATLHSFTAPSAGTLTLDTEGSALDTILDVEDTAPGGGIGRSIAFDDDSGPGLTSRVVLGVRSGETVYVFVDGYGEHAGNAQGVAILRWSFATTPDTTPPETRIFNVPKGELGFGGDFVSEYGARFECRVDSEAWWACGPGTDPRPAAPSTGRHTFFVRAIDHAGNADPTPASHVFDYRDPAPPQTFASVPELVSAKEITPSFSADYNGAGPSTEVTFECRLDGSAWAGCVTNTRYTGLAEGRHVFDVRAVSPTGIRDPTPAHLEFAVDTTSPNATITAGPPSTTTARDADLRFGSEPGALLECRLDNERWKACASPLRLGGLAIGEHVFLVRATDVAGNLDPTPAERRWTITSTTAPPPPPPPPPDTTAPETTLTGGPSGTVTTRSATFTFTASEPGGFECRFDGTAWFPCASPKALGDLVDGAHTFEVRAHDAAGNIDATPATRSWTVAATPPSTSDPSPPTTTDPSPTTTTNDVSPPPRTSAGPSSLPADGGGTTSATVAASSTAAPKGLLRAILTASRGRFVVALDADRAISVRVRLERCRHGRCVRFGRVRTVRAATGRTRVVLGPQVTGRVRAVVTTTRQRLVTRAVVRR